MWADPLVAGEVAVGEVGSCRVNMLGVEPITQASARDDALARTIDRLLQRLDIAPKQLDRIAVSGGPGGFTSVRIAVTTAKVMAEVVGAGVAVIPTGEVVARTFRKESSISGDIAVLLAGKRDSAWCAVFEDTRWDDGPWPGAIVEGVMTAETFAKTPGSGDVKAIVADAHAPQAFFDWAGQRGVEIVTPCLSAEAVLVASCFRRVVDPVEAAPVYPREPEAVTKWRDLHGRSESS